MRWQAIAREAGECLSAGFYRSGRRRLPPDDHDARNLGRRAGRAVAVDAGHRALVQPFDIAWQRPDRSDLPDDTLLCDGEQNPRPGDTGLLVEFGVNVAQRAASAGAFLLVCMP
jgi:hypothetical protein